MNRVVRSYCWLADQLEARLKKTRLANHQVGRSLIDAALYPSDTLKVIATYKAAFGIAPNLFRPVTFNEKLQQSKLLTRKKRYVQFADKVRVRDYVARKIGPQYLNDLYWVGEDLNEARACALPNKFVVKSNNGSGTILFVPDAGDFDWDRARKTTQAWLARDHSVHYAEWQYRWIKPQLLIEALLEDPATNQIPVDYKFHVFHGRVEFVQVDYDRFSNHTKSLYDREFQLLPVTYHDPQFPGEYPKPATLAQLMSLAEELADGERYARIDLYDVGRPVFGEITLHPNAGIVPLEPPEWDVRLGRLMR